MLKMHNSNVDLQKFFAAREGAHPPPAPTPCGASHRGGAPHRNGVDVEQVVTFPDFLVLKCWQPWFSTCYTALFDTVCVAPVLYLAVLYYMYVIGHPWYEFSSVTWSCLLTFTAVCPAQPADLTVETPISYHFRSGINGFWMKDPLPMSEEAKTRIYEITDWEDTNQALYYWNTLDDYEAGDFSAR